MQQHIRKKTKKQKQKVETPYILGAPLCLSLCIACQFPCATGHRDPLAGIRMIASERGGQTKEEQRKGSDKRVVSLPKNWPIYHTRALTPSPFPDDNKTDNKM